MVDLASQKIWVLISTCLGFNLDSLDLRLQAVDAQDLRHPGELRVKAWLICWGVLQGLKLFLKSKNGSIVMCDAFLDALSKEASQL